MITRVAAKELEIRKATSSQAAGSALETNLVFLVVYFWGITRKSCRNRLCNGRGDEALCITKAGGGKAWALVATEKGDARALAPTRVAAELT